MSKKTVVGDEINQLKFSSLVISTNTSDSSDSSDEDDEIDYNNIIEDDDRKQHDSELNRQLKNRGNE